MILKWNTIWSKYLMKIQADFGDLLADALGIGLGFIN